MNTKKFKNQLLTGLGLCAIFSGSLMSCKDGDSGQLGTNTSTTNTAPPKAPNSSESREIVLYYASNNRYSGLTAEDVLSKGARGQDYAHDVFVPSFCTIGDGATANGSESKAWKKNQLGYDDVYAWSGLNWASDGSLVFSNGSNIGTGNINSGLNKYPTKPYGLAIGGWPVGDNANDPIRTGGFDRIGYATQTADLDEFVNNVNNLEPLGKITRLPNSLHVDYEFPLTTLQADGLLRIVKALKTKCGDKYLIDVALGPNIQKHLSILNFTELLKYVDSFELMTYDYNGNWSKVTGHHTGLYANVDGQTDANLSADFAADAQVNYLLGKGVPASKIKIGVALYGRFWTGVTFPSTIDPMQPHFTATGGAVPSSLANGSYFVEGVIKYNQAMEALTAAKGWEIFRDTKAKAPFAINRAAGMFVSFDDLGSIQAKADYVKQKGLGGVIVWEASGAKGTSILKELRKALD